MLEINSYLIKSVRSFIEDKCHAAHGKDKDSALHHQVMEQGIPASTGYCIQSNQCLLSVIGQDSGFKLVGGYALNSSMKPSENLKKSYREGKTAPERRYGWIWDYQNDVAYGLHWWLQSDKNIIDIAADQFGHPKVIIANTNDSRYIIAEADDQDVHADIERSIKEGANWANEFLSMVKSHFIGTDRDLA